MQYKKIILDNINCNNNSFIYHLHEKEHFSNVSFDNLKISIESSANSLSKLEKDKIIDILLFSLSSLVYSLDQSDSYKINNKSNIDISYVTESIIELIKILL